MLNFAGSPGRLTENPLTAFSSSAYYPSLSRRPYVQASASFAANCFAVKGDQRNDAAALASGRAGIKSVRPALSADPFPMLPYD